MEKTILRTEHATMRFGGVTAVNDLNLEVGRDEIVAIIGPNGAGKTTAFNLITGVYTPTEGKVFFTPGRHHPHGHGTHLSEHPPVQDADGL